MQKWGKTTSGTQRWCCAKCKSVKTWKRPDRKIQIWYLLFVRWITNSEHLNIIAKQCSVSIRALHKRFVQYWSYLPRPLPIKDNTQILVIDGVSIVKHQCVVLVVQDPIKRKPVYWSFVFRECYKSWISVFHTLKANGIDPSFVVCDGQKGLIKALNDVYPKAVIQRCMIHVVRQARLFLTKKPKTTAGIKLLFLVSQLFTIQTKRQKRRWIRMYKHWLRKHNLFLKERTHHPVNNKKWWYTHRKLRAVRSLLNNSLPHLFTFVRYREVPKTSNHVEGGINSRLKDLLRIHRGLSKEKRVVLAAWYLATRQGQKPTQKPTRKFH